MDRHLVLVLAVVLSLSAVASGAPFGTDITVPDRTTGLDHRADGYDSWYHGGPPFVDDNEVESGWIGQENDLEAWFLDGSVLTMVGGWDFVGAETYGTGGAVFFDVDGDIRYGGPDLIGTGPAVDGVPGEIPNVFGYDYALVMRFGAAPVFDLYALDDDSVLMSVEWESNETAGPWTLADDALTDPGALLASDVSFTYLPELSSTEVGGLLGAPANPDAGDATWSDVHNVVRIDLSSIGTWVNPLASFAVHHTMECGNDDLIGIHDPQGIYLTGEPLPEPSTLALLGLGLGVLIVRVRRRR